MRKNFPVTQKEWLLPEGTIIVSRTDLKGRITYVNDEFLEASGFTESELMNQPHNLVRHPDMPEEAFQDLWDTLRGGKPWTGVVKNRRKNGDHYWVLANATPVREGGTVTGYISVRTRPSREQVEACAAAYALFREGKASGLIIRDGGVVRTGLADWLNVSEHATLGQKFALAGSLVVLSAAGAIAALAMGTGGGLLAGLLAAVLAAGLFASVRLVRRLSGSLLMLAGQTSDMAQGEFERIFDARGRDAVAELRRSLQALRTRIGFDISETRRSANRLKQALDHVTTSVLMADRFGNIMYLNRAIAKMLENLEAELRKSRPEFRVGALIGSSLGALHDEPAFQGAALEALRQPRQATLQLGGRIFVVSIVPVTDDQGVRLGTAVEWLDRTAEIAAESEMAQLVEAAKDGDFSKRARLEGKDGFFLTLAAGMNGLIDTTAEGLAEVVRVQEALARGDLTQRMERDFKGTFGQLKESVNATVARLSELMRQIGEATESINVASKEIASGNTDLSQRTEEQASSLEETASSMEELTGTVKQNAENASQANQLAAGASEVAVRGGTVVRQVVETMGSINDSSKKIVEIISVIDGIAFQTNILALNAAVEAARAGEQGRGFAVVATEVRNLAQRSASAAKEIKGLIGDSVEKVRHGSTLVDEAGRTMDEIVTSVKRVTDIMSEITAASQEQSGGIEQVNTAITQMDEVTQQNAALVEQAAAAAESLEEQARALAQSVGTFKLAGATRSAAPAGGEGPGRNPEANVRPFPAKEHRTLASLSP
jgi:methyl-accepting chemotaxis protein